MASPNSARRTSKAVSEGAKAQENSITLKQRILTISTGRRPYLSANVPNSSAPTGLNTCVHTTPPSTAEFAV